jgi:hypothetical protein
MNQEGKISWDIWDISGERFVCEKVMDGASCIHHAHFGPMKADEVGPFLDDRREHIADANRGTFKFEEDAIWTEPNGVKGDASDPFDAFLKTRSKG